MTDVTLKLSKPYMVYNPEKADKIVLPAEKGPLTVISGAGADIINAAPRGYPFAGQR